MRNVEKMGFSANFLGFVSDLYLFVSLWLPRVVKKRNYDTHSANINKICSHLSLRIFFGQCKNVLNTSLFLCWCNRNALPASVSYRQPGQIRRSCCSLRQPSVNVIFSEE